MGNISRSCCRDKPAVEGALTTQTDWVFVDNVKKKLDDLTERNDAENQDYWHCKDNVTHSSNFQKLESTSTENVKKSERLSDLSVEVVASYDEDIPFFPSTLESKAILNPCNDDKDPLSSTPDSKSVIANSNIRASFSENDVRRSKYLSTTDSQHRSETQITPRPSSEYPTRQRSVSCQQEHIKGNDCSHMPNEFRVFKQRILRHKASLRNDGNRRDDTPTRSVSTVSDKVVEGRSTFCGDYKSDRRGRYSSPEGTFDIEFENVSPFRDKRLVELSKSSYI